ncbi:PREDICTED: uncharacterized protein LOC109591471 [Amphimedon queenslandica]|uniref:SRCR domain-containing protein n=1 Tax=Amphimedon queenslandica TaxID=400682 RepID=A0AAN0K0T4_AMPQE|nr:PREDICTED: uncharacterized protein LOC109591471 [Amphimedon queenslandica]|eukprot:XP_019862777.1 PREDICTED: uncharacterized protein LOC109591471 [Amphimedon queenslandica]
MQGAMSMIFVLFAFLVLLHLLTFPVSAQSDCSLPSQSNITHFITEFLTHNDAGSVEYSPTIIGSVHYVCQAQGSRRGTYRSLSIIATYTPNPGQSQTTGIFQLMCSSGSWEADLDGGIPVPVSGLIDIPTRTDCLLCNHTFGSDRCHACGSSCNTGLKRCVGSQTNCCSYFSPTDQCTTQCPTNFYTPTSTDFICSICSNSCEAGYTRNTTTCTCSLSNICELSPCQNGGSCTLVSAPSNYSCDCTGTGYQGLNCSTRIYDWSTAASKHVIGILPLPVTVKFGIIDLVITTPETEAVNFTVSNLTQTIANGSVTAGTSTTIWDSILLSYAVNSELERYKGLLVTTGTDKKISVTVAITDPFHSAAVYINYPVLFYPVNSYVYYAVSIGTDESTSFSSLLIVSSNNNTNIRITPTVTVTIPSSVAQCLISTNDQMQISLEAGQSITIQLQYLETFLLKPAVEKADLTGTKLKSNSPISVYSGHSCVVGQSACNFAGEQIPPVASWGNEFLVQSYNRQSSYKLKLIGSQANTNVNILCDEGNSTYSLSLQEGGVLSQTILSQTSCYVSSTSPILVAWFSVAERDMTIIPPLHQYASNVTSIPNIIMLGDSFVNLVVLAADDSSQIRLNSMPLPSLTSSSWEYYSTFVNGCYVFNSYSLFNYGEVTIWSNNSDDKILAMVYGYYQTYFYSGSIDLKPSEGYICELSPCQNGGSCTLVSAPFNYTCNCTDTGYQGINCSTPIPCKTGSINLVNGSHDWEGRVEVYINESWGTVCDNNWDSTDAAVVCRQLGWGTSGSPLSFANFGQGAVFHLDNVQCLGTEQLLTNCTHLSTHNWWKL